MDNRGTCWSITINNPTATEEEQIALARQRGWQVDGQLERGTEGTPHYQLIVKTPQVRFSAVKKVFTRGHIELARNSKALEQYVHKDDTRVAGLPTGSDRYPSQKRFFELVWDVILEDDGNANEYKIGKNDRFINPPVNALNKATSALIRQGYVVEGMAANPMTIAIWNQFHDALLARKILGETIRQTDARSTEQHASIPIEHNHAVCSSSQVSSQA